MDRPLHARTAIEIADDVRRRRVRAADVVAHHLERIRRLDGPIGAFVHVDAEGAAAAAAEVDARVQRGEDPGPLAGVPIGVKELEDVAGWPHPRGSRVLADQIAATTSTQVTRLRRAGAIPVGLTASPEMGAASYTASLLHGVCRNPWNPALTPGGSSGGSAAAVALGLVPLATGSDSGGSLRIPAAYCGLVGFKGTYGRIPRGPLYVGLPNVRNYGALARTVADAARFLDCVVGADERDPLSLPHPGFSFEERVGEEPLRGLRAAWTEDLGFGACAPEMVRLVREAASALVRAAGLREVACEVRLPDPGDAWPTFLAPDLHALYAPFLPDRAGDVHPILSFMLGMTERLGTMDFARAGHARDGVVQRLADVFEQVDLLLLPTTSVPAFAAEGPMPTEIDGRSLPPIATVAQTYVFNLSGHPAVSVPAGMLGGAPVGLQIVGRRHDDVRVLAAAAAFERLRPWPALAPEDAVTNR
jgi:aspartyl-tRNA(Asn)/glutamyl-tRNA(Gln) amidotransferase subunit A